MIKAQTTREKGMKSLSLKSVCILITLTFILTTGVWYVLAPAPTSTFWVTSGAYPGGVTYTIWREGNNYHAKNAYGQLASFSGGTNISYVAGQAGASGGKLFFLDATYMFDSPFIVVSNTTIEGEGWNTIFQWNASAPGIMTGVIRGSEAGGTEENIIITNIHIRGNGPASGAGHINLAGIYWNYTAGGVSVQHLSIDRVKFTGMLERAVHIEDSRYVSVTRCYSYALQKAGITTGAQHSVLIGNTMVGRGDGNEDNGVELIGDPNDPFYVMNVTVANNLIIDHLTGIEIRLAFGVTISNNRIINSLHSAIDIGEGATNNPRPENIQISDNFCENVRGSGYAGIEINATMFDCSGNTVYPNAFGILLSTASNGTVSHNRIFNGAIGYAASAAIHVDVSTNLVVVGNYMVDNNVPQEMQGIMETSGAADWNMYIGNNARFCQAPAIVIQGANSKVTSCWNGSSWIEHG